MPSPGPVSAQNTPGTASHLCPKLSDICLPADCQTLFLPHLNILKATPAPVAPPKPTTNLRAEPYSRLSGWHWQYMSLQVVYIQEAVVLIKGVFRCYIAMEDM